MPFFLLAKGPDGDLRLVSDAVFDARSEAIAELNRLTADSDFGHWDAMLYVADLDAATEVLLVRPAAVEAASEPEAAAEPEAEPAADEAVSSDAAPAEPEAEPEERMVEPEESEPAPQHEDAALAAVLEGLGGGDEDAAVSLADDVVVEEPEAVPGESVAEVDDAWAQAVAESEGPEPEAPALKDALQRTAAQMEAEGISAPESVGPEEPGASAAEAEEVAAWPWDTAPAEEPAFSLDALEEPGTDDGSLVRAAGDDDTMAAARPVILGAYDAPMPDQPIAEPMGVEIPMPGEAAEGAPVEVAPEPALESAPPAEPESDFILDLEEIVSTAPAEPGYVAPAESTGSMSCNDCVYVDTCPNKDQRDPQTCGSFQWK